MNNAAYENKVSFTPLNRVKRTTTYDRHTKQHPMAKKSVIDKYLCQHVCKFNFYKLQLQRVMKTLGLHCNPTNAFGSTPSKLNLIKLQYFKLI